MLLVDSSVWIDYFNGVATPQTDYLHAILSQREIVVGDITRARCCRDSAAMPTSRRHEGH